MPDQANRFEAFTDEERAILSFGLALYAAELTLGAVLGSDPLPREEVAPRLLPVMGMIDEIAVGFGLQPLDPDLVGRIREVAGSE